MALITIAGGTGTVGTHLIYLLSHRGLRLRVLTREPAKISRPAPGVEYVGIDFDDSASLRRALEGSGKAFLCTGTSARQVRDEIALIDAAVVAGVPHLVNLSVGGAGQGIANNVLQWHSEIDAHLMSRNTAWTLLRPATYADTTLRVAAGFVPRDLWGGTCGTGRVSLIDTRDVAAVAAAVLTQDTARHAGSVYDLTGPDALDMQDIARLMSAATGQDVRYHDRSAPEQRAVYASAGMPALKIDVLMGLDDLTRQNVFMHPTAAVQDVTGAAARTVAALVRERLGTVRNSP